jgi:hypothetical protein
VLRYKAAMGAYNRGRCRVETTAVLTLATLTHGLDTAWIRKKG